MKNILILFLLIPVLCLGQVVDNNDSIVCNIQHPYYQSVMESDTSWLSADPGCQTKYTFDIIAPLVAQVFIRKSGVVVFESLIYGSPYWNAPYSGYIEYQQDTLVIVNGGPFDVPADYRFRNFGTTVRQVEYMGRFVWTDDEPFELGVGSMYQKSNGEWYSFNPIYEIYSHCIEIENEIIETVETCDRPSTPRDTITDNCGITVLDSVYVGTPDTVIYRYWERNYNDTTYWTGPNDFGCDFTVTTIWIGTGDPEIYYYNLLGQMVQPKEPGIYIKQRCYDWGSFAEKVFLRWPDIEHIREKR